MNILLIVPEFPPHNVWWGGFVFESLAHSYKNLWHNVLVITWDHTIHNIFRRLQVVSENTIDVLRIPEFYSPISLLNTVLPYPAWYNPRIKKVIKQFSPKFIHIHGYGLFMPAQVSKICVNLWYDYTFTIHGAPISPEKMKNKIISISYNFYHKYYGFPTLRNAKKQTAVSSFARDFEIFSKYKDTISIIWNWLRSSDYIKPDYDIFSKKNIRTSEKTKIIFSLWRIEWIKGFDKIIQLLPKMREELGLDIVYVIAWRDNWEKQKLLDLAKSLDIENHVHFIWFLEWNDKLSGLYSSDIIAIPSESESYWLVWLEARIVKKPIITTFAGWLKDALAWYKHAYELTDYKKALSTTISDEEVENSMMKSYEWDSIAKEYLHKNI